MLFEVKCHAVEEGFKALYLFLNSLHNSKPVSCKKAVINVSNVSNVRGHKGGS